METNKADLSQLHVLVLAGGASSRFYPVNKVFADPTGVGRSLIQQTYDRVAGGDDPLLSADRFFVVCGSDAAPEIQKHLPIPQDNILVEPDRRNTFPAILWGLAHIRLKSPQATVAILTSDHIIGDLPIFRGALTEAAKVAQEQDMVGTLAIQPDSDPQRWASFGTIQADLNAPLVGDSAHNISCFEEKPAIERAQEMIAEGGWSWNSGMFMFRAEVLEKVMGHFHPETAVLYTGIVESLGTGNQKEAANNFSKLKGKIPHPELPNQVVDHSIDFAIMMPLSKRPPENIGSFVIPAKFSWHDIGSWDALRSVLTADSDNNLLIGDVKADKVINSILLAESGMTLEVEGLKNVAIIHTVQGEVLISNADEVSGIKPVVEAIRTAGANQVVYRECENCTVDSPEGSVALFKVENLKVQREGNILRVCQASPEKKTAQLSEQALDSLCKHPQSLLPTVNHYAWGGQGLPDLLGQAKPSQNVPIAEAWLTATLDQETSASLKNANIKFIDWVQARPEILGAWSDCFYAEKLPLFLKFLSSRFPSKVHLGFNPEAVKEVEKKFDDSFKSVFSKWVFQERDLLLKFHSLLNTEACTTQEVFESFKRAHDEWVGRQCHSNWQEDSADHAFIEVIEPFLRDASEPGITEAVSCLKKLRENRNRMVTTLNEVDLEQESGNLLLSPSGCAHSIFGLSHQCHTHDPLKEELSKSLSELRAQVQAGNDDLEDEYHDLKEKFNQLRSKAKEQDPPKNEAWLPFQFGGETFLLEPQQRSNTTYSWLDLYTPFEFKNGRFSFRKGDPENGISDEKLNQFLDELSFNPKTIDELRYGGETIFEEDHLKVIEYIDDPIAWPYFTLHKMELDGSETNVARYELHPPRGSFIQIATLKGQADLIQLGKLVAQTHPGSPIFIPATLEDNIEIVAQESTEIVFMSVPTPWSMSSQLAYANCDSNSIPSV